MLVFVTFLFFVASSCNARPNIIDINPQNVVTVPTNCPEGWAWINGACREIWSVTAIPANIVTVPTNCPPGQSFINGQCRDVWIKTLISESNLREIQPDDSDLSPQNLITVPPNCRPGQQWINGSCRDVWKGLQNINDLNIGYKEAHVENYEYLDQNDANRNVISVPDQCPVGYRPDALGNCRPIFN